MSLVMHYICPETDADKPAIETKPGPQISDGPRVLGRFSAGGRFKIACGLPTDAHQAKPKGPDDTGFFDGVMHRATNVTYAGVSCKGCRESMEFQRDWQPHPGDPTGVNPAIETYTGTPDGTIADAPTIKSAAVEAVAPCAGC